MSVIIKPTVGRVVWFYKYVPGNGYKGPLAAHICAAWGDACVNLMVIDEGGTPRGETSVRLIQDGDAPPEANYCCWMPYQKGQAAKTEALEKELKTAS